MGPVLMMITDRRRTADRLLERVATAARAGVHLIHLREPDLDGREYVSLATACVDAVRGTSARVLVNDRIDVALAAGASGVHLRADSVPTRRARELLPRPALIGRSVHGPGEFDPGGPAEGADYLVFGTVFPSASKPGRAPAGVGVLAGIAALTPLPVLAVGGMTADRVGGVASSGAAGFAAISLFRDTPLAALAETIDGLQHAWVRGARRT